MISFLDIQWNILVKPSQLGIFFFVKLLVIQLV